MHEIYLGLYGLFAIVLFIFFAVRLNKNLGFSPFFFAVVGFVCFDLIGLLLIVLGLDPVVDTIPVLNIRDMEKFYKASFFFHVVNVSFLFLVGAAIGKKIKIKKIQIAGQNLSEFNFAITVGIIGLAVLGMIISFWYMASLAEVPLFSIFQGFDVIKLGQLRAQATLSFDGSYIIVSLGTMYLLPFCSWYFMCKFFASNNAADRQKFFIAFVVLFIASSVMAIINLQKAPLLIYFFFTVCVYIVVANKKINIKLSILTVTFSLILICLLYKYFMSVNENIFLAIWYGLQRILYGQIYPGFLYLDYFPKIKPYLYGKGLPIVWTFFSEHRYLADNELWNYYFTSYKQLGLQGTINAAYYMQFYAEFGYIGMYGIALIAGFLVMLTTQVLRSFMFLPLVIPLTFLFARQFLKLSMSNFTIAICGSEMLLLLGLLFLIVMLAKWRTNFYSSLKIK